MTISRMLGATMVAGALATGGAAAGIASASASPTTSTTAANTTTNTQSTTPSTSTTTTTTPPATTTTPPGPKSGSTSGKPCPNMGSGASGNPKAGASYAPGPVGASAQ
jgi:hypothetical protein